MAAAAEVLSTHVCRFLLISVTIQRAWLDKDAAKGLQATNSKWSLKPKTQPCSLGAIFGIRYRQCESF